MVNTQPQYNAAMQPSLAYGSPQPQDTAVVGGFQPQSPVMMGTMQPQSPVPMGNIQPYDPVAMGATQPQSPVVINTVQPQAMAPMKVYSTVYGDHGANNHPMGPDGKRGWTYGLMGCFDRFGLCCWATWCPCVVYSKTRERLRSLQYQGRPLAGGGERYSTHCCIYTAMLFIGHPWIMQVQPRAEIRERYAIRGHVINDWLVSLCCTSCALTQERREVEVEEASFRAAEQVQQVVQVHEK